MFFNIDLHVIKSAPENPDPTDPSESQKELRAEPDVQRLLDYLAIFPSFDPSRANLSAKGTMVHVSFWNEADRLDLLNDQEVAEQIQELGFSLSNPRNNSINVYQGEVSENFYRGIYRFAKFADAPFLTSHINDRFRKFDINIVEAATNIIADKGLFTIYFPDEQA